MNLKTKLGTSHAALVFHSVIVAHCFTVVSQTDTRTLWILEDKCLSGLFEGVTNVAGRVVYFINLVGFGVAP
jgi:hypothetical protein